MKCIAAEADVVVDAFEECGGRGRIRPFLVSTVDRSDTLGQPQPAPNFNSVFRLGMTWNGRFLANTRGAIFAALQVAVNAVSSKQRKVPWNIG